MKNRDEEREKFLFFLLKILKINKEKEELVILKDLGNKIL